jgi:hypothetical protein
MDTTPYIPIASLRAGLNGNVIALDDPGYDDARRVFSPGSTAGLRRSSASAMHPMSPAQLTWHGRQAPSSRCAAAARAAPGSGPPRAGSSWTSPR